MSAPGPSLPETALPDPLERLSALLLPDSPAHELVQAARDAAVQGGDVDAAVLGVVRQWLDAEGQNEPPSEGATQ